MWRFCAIFVNAYGLHCERDGVREGLFVFVCGCALLRFTRVFALAVRYHHTRRSWLPSLRTRTRYSRMMARILEVLIELQMECTVHEVFVIAVSPRRCGQLSKTDHFRQFDT